MQDYQNLNYYLGQAKNNGQAIGHFNFATADVLRAIVTGAKEAGASAVMVGTSEGEAKFLGMREAVALVKAMREELQFPIFLNADHYKSFEKCKEAIDLGYDSVIIDSKLSFEENISVTKRVTDYARSISSDISVEGEIGYLKGSSEIQTKVEISPADYTKPEQAEDFVTCTGVDRLAIVFGNIHGIVTDQEEHLDIPHLKKISAAIPQALLVLHGASGLADGEVAAAIKAGIVNVHFNTELRVAYATHLDEALHAAELPDGGERKALVTTPYKYMVPAADEVQKLVVAKTRLFLEK